jgi:4-hydroxy-2-oxoheptanedioate aldolase
MIENKLKAMLERGERPTQACVMSGSTFITHNVAQIGADSVWIDLQHGPATIASLCDLVMAAGHENCPFVRVPSVDGGILEKAVVDAGVHGVICPMVDTPEQAAMLVEKCNDGAKIRKRRSVKSPLASEECLAVVQIESLKGFENLEAICATPGLFGILPGPTDLSVAFGGPVGPGYFDDAQVARLRRIIDVAHKHGLYVALPAMGRDQLNAVLDFGADWTILPGFDITWLLEGGRAALALVRDVLDERARTVPA